MRADMDREQKVREAAWGTYHDIQILEEMGFVPVGFPPLNPEDTTDDYNGLSNVYEYNSAITLMKFGPCESVLTARPCVDEIVVKMDGREYKMLRAYLHCGECADKCI